MTMEVSEILLLGLNARDLWTQDLLAIGASFFLIVISLISEFFRLADLSFIANFACRFSLGEKERHWVG